MCGRGAGAEEGEEQLLGREGSSSVGGRGAGAQEGEEQLLGREGSSSVGGRGAGAQEGEEQLLGAAARIPPGPPLHEMQERAASEAQQLEGLLLEGLPWTPLADVALALRAMFAARQEMSLCECIAGGVGEGGELLAIAAQKDSLQPFGLVGISIPDL